MMRGQNKIMRGWGWRQDLQGRVGDWGKICGDGVGIGKVLCERGGDGDEQLSPCSSLIDTHETDRKSAIMTGRETDRQADRQTDRQVDKKTDDIKRVADEVVSIQTVGDDSLYLKCLSYDICRR